jgi:acetyl-CoA carboxylase, biotin carboxylase subunit
VLIKPSAGGGGKGMRMVRSPRELQQALTICRSEALAAFGDDSLYLEKWIDENRHVEVQVVVDRYGNGVHVGERDCSVQRRHQKIIEEAPARRSTRRAARRSRGRAGGGRGGRLRERGHARVPARRDGNYYFIEINCRIQVEHPVTEMLSGIDLVAEQIRIAAGEPLGYSQADVVLRGHAIEFRINAEDIEHDFRPRPASSSASCPGGPGVRMDSHLYSGYEVPPYYDSLLGKLIVWGPDRRPPSPAAGSRSTSWSSTAC